jgi:Toprim domain/CHC2 zinc finger
MSQLWSNAPAERETRAEQARAVRIEDEIARRGIKLRGGVDRCGPCPVCGGRDRFAINVKKQVWNCRICARGGDVIELVRHLDGLGFKEAVAALTGHALPRERTPSGQSEPAGYVARAELKRAASALPWKAIWAEAQDPRRTLVDAYLRSRRLELPVEAAGEAVRFHPACFFGKECYPAMVCLVRNIATNEPQGVHRTAIMPDGTAIKRDGKTFRMSLGPTAGGAIKIDPDEDVTQGLCIGEGVETCLSGRQLGLQPVWSIISVGGIERFPVLPDIDRIQIIRENDPNGASERAVKKCADRWYEAGREVFIVASDIGNDLNDELLGGVQ